MLLSLHAPALSTPWERGAYIYNVLFNEALAELEKTKRERKNDLLLILDAALRRYGNEVEGQRVCVHAFSRLVES